jgi:hypothetical protein
MSRIAEAPVRPAGQKDPRSDLPRRRGLVVALSALAGFLLTVVWSAEFVDTTIGGNVAGTLLGHEAEGAALGSVTAGVLFALVSGIAGTFTACNIAVFGALAPMVGAEGTRWQRLGRILRPVGWLSAGMIAVAATYGAIVGIVGTRMPQFDTAPNVPGELSARSIQSMVVFGIIGLSMLYLGLAALRLVPDPLARLARRRPNAPMVVMGVLVGGFLIGRPYPLFRQLFRDAAESGNPLYSAAAFVLQSLGNIVIVVLLVLLLSSMGRLRRWLTADPRRMTTLIAVSFIVAGVFTFLYWDVRLLDRREIIPWYPVAPWG